ncbi:hypothetical protein C0995_000593 [Termitomyces sp. Mi166|nr:hypothetical protein C0995_000593 [Termitomyces sp. Mi166\
METRSGLSPAMSDVDDSNSDDTPTVSKRKLDTTIDISDEEQPRLVITIPPRKNVKPSSSASVETEVDVLMPDFSQEDSLIEQHLPSLLELEPPQTAPTSPPSGSSHESLHADVSLNMPDLTIPQDLQNAEPRAQDELVEPNLENVTSGRGISTKQRLSSGALTLRPPKDILNTVRESKNQLPPPRAPYTSLIPLGFRKGTVPTSSMAIGSYPELQEPTLSSINALPSPNTRDDLYLSLQDQPMQNHSMYTEPGDEFLEELMLSSFINVKPTEECHVELPHQQLSIPERLSTSKPSQKPQESWTWSVDVFTSTEPSRPVFAVTINGFTTQVNQGLSFREALVGMEHLYFTSFYDAVDFDSILPASQETRQFARLGPRTSADAEPFELFCKYMVKIQKVVLLPIFLNNIIAGHVTFFHPNTLLITSRLKPPLEIRNTKGLVAALVPWTLSEYQYLKNYDHKHPNEHLPSQTDMEPLVMDKNLWLRSIKSRPRYHHGLRVLKFPRTLHNYFCENGYERTCSVWYEGGDGTKRPGMETLDLFSILDKCGIKRSHIQDARIVFIHTGAVKYLHNLAGFLDICSTSFSVQLYIYGSHETVASELWGVHEVYPCGGIVTFTPQALLDDLPGVINRISQIQSHPLWECYIIPSVLGMAAILHCLREGIDPISDFDG